MAGGHHGLRGQIVQLGVPPVPRFWGPGSAQSSPTQENCLPERSEGSAVVLAFVFAMQTHHNPRGAPSLSAPSPLRLGWDTTNSPQTLFLLCLSSIQKTEGVPGPGAPSRAVTAKNKSGLSAPEACFSGSRSMLQGSLSIPILVFWCKASSMSDLG